jgi:hypothetical protein
MSTDKEYRSQNQLTKPQESFQKQKKQTTRAMLGRFQIFQN